MRPFILVLLSAFTFTCKHADTNQAALKAEIREEPLDLTLEEWGFDITRMPPDAQRGLRTAFAGLGFRMLIEESLFQKLINLDPQRQWQVYGNPPSPRSRAKLAPTPSFKHDARGRTTTGKDVGANFAVYEQDGRKYMSFTCLQCHTGVVAGKLVAGLGNSHIDQFALVENLKQYRRYRDLFKNRSEIGQNLIEQLTGLTDQDIEHLKWFTLYSETVLRPALKGASSRGDDFGPFPVWQLMSRLKDPGKTGFDLLPLESGPSQLEQLVASTPLGPVDRRPWWLRKHDTKSYVYGDTLTDPRSGKDFAINFTVPHTGHNETYHSRAKLTADILAFALWTKSPPYPYDENRASSAYDPRPSATEVDQGLKVYNRDCARCHGQVVSGRSKRWALKYKSMPYAGKHAYWQKTCLSDVLYSTETDAAGNSVDPAWTQDTDLTYSCALMRFNRVANAAAPVRRYFSAARFGIPEDWLPAVYNPEKPGYRAPPIVGIWASAPYLHNGSLPTLGDLFNHPTLNEGGGKPRPLGWSRVLDVSKDLSYDLGMVGMQVQPYFARSEFPKNPGLPYDHKRQVNYRRFYDTTQLGKHRYGAKSCGSQLSVADKDSLLAFFKEFTDQNVEPDSASCPHPPKARERDYGYRDYPLKDHALCKLFYKKNGISTY